MGVDEVERGSGADNDQIAACAMALEESEACSDRARSVFARRGPRAGRMMRKQYHLRRGDDGFDAWDVDRLIELVDGNVVRQVPLDSIAEIDSAYWFADSGEPATVRNVVEHVRLMRDVDISHPIILGPDGRLMDGMHRVANALLDGRTHIAAVQLDAHTEPDFRNCDPEDLPYGR